jgi:hypothetical protein
MFNHRFSLFCVQPKTNLQGSKVSPKIAQFTGLFKQAEQPILFPGCRKIKQGWRGGGAPRPRAAAWRRARPGKNRDRTPPEIGLTPEKELLTQAMDRLKSPPKFNKVNIFKCFFSWDNSIFRRENNGL